MEGRDRSAILLNIASEVQGVHGADFPGLEFRGLLAV